MLPQRLKLLRQNRRRKTIEWKKHLDRRLLLQEVCDAGSHIRDATSATLTAWSPYIINCLSLTSEAVTRCSSQLSVISMVTALLCCAVQFCCLSGALQVIKNPPASKCEFGWMKIRPIPNPGQPFTIFLLGAAPRTVFLGLDSEVTVNDVMADLRRRHLVPDLARVQHTLYFPRCRYGPLKRQEHLMDLGVSDLSTLHLRTSYLGGSPDKCAAADKENKDPDTGSNRKKRPSLDDTSSSGRTSEAKRTRRGRSFSARNRQSGAGPDTGRRAGKEKASVPPSPTEIETGPSTSNRPRRSVFLLDPQSGASPDTGRRAGKEKAVVPSPPIEIETEPSASVIAESGPSTSYTYHGAHSPPPLEPVTSDIFDDSDSDTKESDLDISSVYDYDIQGSSFTSPPHFTTQQPGTSSLLSTAHVEDEAQTSLAGGSDWEATLDWANGVDLDNMDWIGMGWPGMEDEMVSDATEAHGATDVEPAADVGADFYLRLDSPGDCDPPASPDMGGFGLDASLGVGDGLRLDTGVDWDFETVHDDLNLSPSAPGVAIGDDHDTDAEDDLDFFNDEVDADFYNWTEEQVGGGYVEQTPHSSGDRSQLSGIVDKEAESPDVSPAQSPPQVPRPASPESSPSSPEGLETTPSANSHAYNGKTCSCTAEDHLRDPSLATSSHLHVDHGCGIMEVLRLAFHRRHRYLICLPCRSFVPLGQLKQHHEKKHPELLRGGKTGKRTSRRDFPAVVEHFSTSLGIDPNQDVVTFDQASLDGPVHGLQDPILTYQCTTCGSLHQTVESIRTHMKNRGKERSMCHGENRPEHQCDGCGALHRTAESLHRHSTDSCGRVPPTPVGRLGDVPTVWTQAPFLSGKHITRIEVSGPLDSSAATTSASEVPVQRYVVPDGVNSFCPPWLQKLGWAKWRDTQIQRGMTMSQLTGFAASTPPPRKGHKPPSGPLSEKEIFEWAAGRMRTRLEKMVEDANAWLNTSNLELRLDITAKTKSKFREIANFPRYARNMHRIVLVLLRYKHQPDVADIPNLGLKRTQRQDQAISALHDFVYGTDPLAHGDIDDEYDTELDGLLHELLESLFYQELHLSDWLGCPTDTALILTSLNQDGSFPKPSRITFMCAVLQYFARTTVVHTLRLHSGGHSCYTPLTAGDPVVDDDQIVTDNDGSFTRRLHELRKFIIPPSENNLACTPYTHIKLFWLIAASGSRAERTKVRLAWESSKEAFEYLRPGITQVRIAFSALRTLIHGNEEQLSELFESLLPSSFPISAVNNLPWHTLRDNGSNAESFLDAEETWNDWMRDAVTAIKKAYLDEAETRHGLIRDGKPSLAAFDDLLNADRKFQETLVGTIVGNTGISPRAVNVCNLAYRSNGKEERNVHLTLDSVVLSGGRQKSEYRRDGEREFALRAMSPHSGKIAVRYLALCRRAIVEIMKENNWYTDSISAYETRVFAKPTFRKGANGNWDVSEITASWHSCSESILGARLSLVDMRQITTGIFREHFPDLLQAQSSSKKTAIDGQGDHGPDVNKNNYGLNAQLFNGHSAPDTHDFIQASRIYQAMMQTVPLDVHWPSYVLSSPLFNSTKDEALALDVAHHLIKTYYSLGQMQPEALPNQLQMLYDAFPFLFVTEPLGGGRSVHLKDVVLHNVVAVLAFGQLGAHSSSVLPRGTECIVDALALILKTLDSWPKGDGLRLVDETNPQVHQRYAEFRSSVRGLLLNFQDERSADWADFMACVRRCRPPILTSYTSSDLCHVNLSVF